jgi:hypothetical protein
LRLTGRRRVEKRRTSRAGGEFLSDPSWKLERPGEPASSQSPRSVPVQLCACDAPRSYRQWLAGRGYRVTGCIVATRRYSYGYFAQVKLRLFCSDRILIFFSQLVMLLLQYFPSCSLSTSTVESDPRQQTERQIRFQLPSVLFLPIFSAFAFWHSPIQDEASLSRFF